MAALALPASETLGDPCRTKRVVPFLIDFDFETDFLEGMGYG
jgi:hypothetical protein